MNNSQKLVMLTLGAVFAAPVGMTLFAKDAQAGGYALAYRSDGGSSCNPGGSQDCPN
jgi:hypothetical protein